MGKKSRQQKIPGDTNQKKNITYSLTQPISPDSNEKPPNNKKTDITISPEIEADFVLGNFIDQLLKRHNSNNISDNKNIPNGDIHKLDTKEFENNSAKYEISDSCVELFLDKNILELEDKYIDIANKENLVKESSIAANSYNSLSDEKIESEPEEQQSAEKSNDQEAPPDNVVSSNEEIPAESSSTKNSSQELEEKTELRIKAAAEENLIQEEDFNAAAEETDAGHVIQPQSSKEITDLLFENEVAAIFETTMNFEEESVSIKSNVNGVTNKSKIDMSDEKLNHLCTGIKFYKEKNYEDAIIEFKKVLKIDPDYKIAYRLLANSFFRNSMFIEALELYEQLKKKSQSDSIVHENLGIIYSKLGMHQLAAKEWNALLKLHPEKTDIQKKLDKTLHHLNHDEEHSKVTHTDKKVKLIISGIEYYKNKDYDSAIQVFKGAINRYPDEKDAYNFLANVYFRKKMLKEALHTYEAMKRKNKGNITAYENMGLIYAKQGEYSKALNEWNKVIEANPERQDIQKKIKKVQQTLTYETH